MFDRAVCLNIDRRIGERGRISEEFSAHGIQVEFFLAGNGSVADIEYDHIDVRPVRVKSTYPAFQARPNSYNAFLCFQKIIRKAQSQGVETLLILEDDVHLNNDFGDVASAAWKELFEVDPDWQLFYLGANHTWSRTKEVAPHLLRLNGSGCFHAVCLRRNVFDLVLAMEPTEPIDGCVGKRLHLSGHAYAVWPNIAVQQPGFSHCEGTQVNYLSLFLNKGC